MPKKHWEQELDKNKSTVQSANANIPKSKNCTLEERTILIELMKNPSATQKEF